MMHREVIVTRKIPVIIISLLVITVGLYLSEGIELIGWKNHMVGDILNTILLLFTIIVVVKEIRSCSLSYKYEIIEDKLIVNSMSSKDEKNLESVKISDIVYMGKKCEIPKEYLSIKSNKNYLCNIVGEESYCCIYRKNDRAFKFSFQPSNKFIQRIIKHSCLYNNCKK
ncbi:MAG: hypothetical protein RSG52_15285 [Terrisporobacter sp.]|uniref:hypothetical protein n=1 Tax=Clostridia TaxID=186801 RepID=UPI002FC6F6E3